VSPDENRTGFGFKRSGSSLATATEEHTQRMRRAGKRRGFILLSIFAIKLYGLIITLLQIRYFTQVNNFPVELQYRKTFTFIGMNWT
jgi:hypothetical protein